METPHNKKKTKKPWTRPKGQDSDGGHGRLSCCQSRGLTPKRSRGAQKLFEARRKVMPTRHYPVIVEQDGDGVFIVDCPVFPGCHSYGITLEEAMENIREAIELCRDEQEEVETLTTFLGLRDIELVV
jgi:predicted RNase H-like HicB family nuclease